MEMSVYQRGRPYHGSCQNHLLRALPSEDLNWILPQLERVPLRRRGIVQFSNSSMHHVYFIEHGLVSVLADTAPGKSIETRMIGPEGFIGVRVVLGKRESCHRRMVQVGGSALRMESDQFADVLESNPAIQQVMLQYVHSIVIQASQLNACNAHHSVQERLARWLLMAHDRSSSSKLPITHKMISRLIGVRRATIGDCMSEMEEKEVIARSRSLITILDRDKLLSMACKCYGLIYSATLP
jgi:CRP-like cAMP-binding protein